MLSGRLGTLVLRRVLLPVSSPLPPLRFAFMGGGFLCFLCVCWRSKSGLAVDTVAAPLSHSWPGLVWYNGEGRRGICRENVALMEKKEENRKKKKPSL